MYTGQLTIQFTYEWNGQKRVFEVTRPEVYSDEFEASLFSELRNLRSMLAEVYPGGASDEGDGF